MNPIPSGSIAEFVRSAWRVLVFQLIAATIALAVTGWAALRVRPLLQEREQLESSIADAKVRIAALGDSESKARQALADLQNETDTLQKQALALRQEIKGAHDATRPLEAAIKAFHAGHYAAAIAAYDEALKFDPNNAYMNNLKSFSQFSAHDYQGAVTTMSRALLLDPAYDWGYFDLARYQCAAGSPDAALDTLTSARSARGRIISTYATYFLKQDGQLRSKCAAILPGIQAIANQAD
jgi:tetratricopeptide (TPR) repeat protein